MIRRLTRIAAVLATMGALVLAPTAAHAAVDAVAPADQATAYQAAQGFHATAKPGEFATLGTIICPRPWLATGYGPIGQCTEISGASGRAGFFSPLTGGFSPTTGWLSIHINNFFDFNVRATDGVVARTRGYASLHTAYGPVVFATQYTGAVGRWGNVNLITGLFYPSSGWMTAV